MSDLPVEMWLQIFSNLEAQDLKNVSASSKNFCGIVSSFPVLSDRFSLIIRDEQLTSDSMKVLQNSLRKYKDITLIGFEHFKKILEVVDLFKDSLESLSLEQCHLSYRNLQKLFKTVGSKLKTLKLYDNEYVEASNSGMFDTLKSLVTLNFSITVHPGNSDLLGKLHMKIGPHSIQILTKILKSQVNLKELRIVFRGQYTTIFRREDLESFKFKLEKFSFYNYWTGIIYAVNGVLEFVDSQKSSLEFLELSGVSYWSVSEKILDSMNKLKSFKYCCHNFSHPNVILKNCPSLKIFELFTQSIEQNLDAVLKEFPNLECLALDYWAPLSSLQFLHTTCPNVSKLRISPYNDELLGNVKLPKLIEVVVDSADCLNLLTNHDLKKLIISMEVKIDSQALKKLLENSGKLQHLEILNGVNLDRDFQYFEAVINEHLKSLKIWNYQLIVETSKFLVQFRPDFRLFTSKFKKISQE
jgi:hypothetical protein